MSQPTTSSAPNGIWRSYSLAEGLAGIHVEHLAQDADGYLWITTSDSGVSRFDGDEFQIFTAANGLSGNQVFAAYRDSQDRLWFGSRDGGVCYYDGRRFHRFSGNDGVSHNSVTFITEDRDGRIWCGGENNIGYYQDDVFRNLRSEYLRSLEGSGLQPSIDTCYGIAQDAAGNMWFGTSALSRYDGVAFRHYGPEAGLPEAAFAYTLAIDARDDLWVGGSQILGRFADDAFHADPLDAKGYLRKIQIDSEERLWICTSGAGVLYRDEDGFKRLTVEDGLTYDAVNAVLADREGHIWFGTWGAGLSCWDPISLQLTGAADGTSLEHAFALLEDHSGSLWMGFAPTFTPIDKNLARRDDGQIRGLSDITDLNRCLCLCADKRDNLYLGGDWGLFRYDGNAFLSLKEELGFPGHTVYSLVCDRQGNLIVGYWLPQQGPRIDRYDGARFTTLFAEPDPQPDDCITALVVSRQDALWFGRGTLYGKDRGKGIGYLRPGAGCTFFTSTEGLVDDRVEDMLEDRHGDLWIATMGGLSRFDGIRFHNYTAVNSDLPNNRIRCLYEDRNGHLWVGTDSGVVHFDGQRFQTVRSPYLTSVTAIVEDRDGYFWFAALHHVVRYAPGDVAPKCRVRRVIADQVYQNPERVELATEYHQVIFEYKGISYRTHPKHMLYTHRLRGYETEWQTAPNGELRAYYRQLPPGEYTFEVRAIDRDFNASATAAVPVTINPDPRIELLAANDPQEVESFIGHSASLRQVLSQISEVAATDLTVLTLGETGTGKGLVARLIHRMSKRHTRPLVQVNCGALPSGLIESELFGHEKGAFTSAVSRKLGKVELAQGGTLFLDEMGDLAPEAQVKLLRLLEEQTFERVGGTETFRADVRVIAATNRNLQQMVTNGTFREDLYFRLQVFPLQLPPLRERREDIPQLATFFMERMAAHLDKPVTRLSPEASAALAAYAWPGNVRELEHSVQRAVIVCKGQTILASDVALEFPNPDLPPSSHAMTLKENERRHILAILEQTGWVIKGPNGAASILDLPSSTLRSRMKKLGIQRP